MEQEKSEDDKNTSCEEDEKDDTVDEVNGNKSESEENTAEDKTPEKVGFAGPCMVEKKKTKKATKRPQSDEPSTWDCNECTYKNNAEVGIAAHIEPR